MTPLTPGEAQAAALRLARLAATGASAEQLTDRLLIDVAGAYGAEGVLDVATAACTLLAVTLHSARPPGVQAVDVIDALVKVAESDDQAAATAQPLRVVP